MSLEDINEAFPWSVTTRSVPSRRLLKGYEIGCDTEEHRGWKALRNGDLVGAAVQNGFDTLRTLRRVGVANLAASPEIRDRSRHAPQLPSQRFLEAFARL